MVPEPGEPGGPLAPIQYLADQLTLFQPGEGRLSPPITAAPQIFSFSGITEKIKNKPENFQPASARQVLIKPALFHNPVFIEFRLQMIGEFRKNSVVI